jgi:cell division protein FtsN
MMSEDHDSRISDLYRQSSQETPPAHLDRAVLDAARKSVRSRVFSPFGNNWIARGAMAGVVVLCVMLILDVPRQPEPYAPEQDAVAPSSEVQPKKREEAARPGALPSELSAEKKARREAPAAPGARFDFYDVLPELEVIVPEDDTPAVMKQLVAPATEAPASAAATTPAEAWYLQAGSFRDKARADALQAKLAELGFKCEIQEATVNKTDIYYRVRVGPFTDSEALENSKQKLGELRIETQVVKEQK